MPMKFYTKIFARQRFIWIIIFVIALLVVFLRTGLQKDPMQSAQNPSIQQTLPYTATPDFTQTVGQIYANANLTLTAIYQNGTPVATSTLPPQAGFTPPTTVIGSPLVEEVHSAQSTGTLRSTPAASLTVPSQNNTSKPTITNTLNAVATGSQNTNTTPSPTAAQTVTLPPLPTPTGADCSYQTNTAFETNLLVLINELRSSQGLVALKHNPAITSIAFVHSEDMACRDFYDHIGSDGASFVERLHNANLFSFAKATELLYVGRGENNSAERAFEAWMAGPSSYSQLIYPAYNHAGIGYVYKEDSTYGGYFTLVLVAIPPGE